MRWHTDFELALRESQQRNRPILSLALLGRLDEELSCANSRFFKLTLYPDPAVRSLMMDTFVLHWASVRPVPKVTIDFGDGRVVTRTVTGNSAHLVLDTEGLVVDAIPGLYTPKAFREALRDASRAAADRRGLVGFHRNALRRIDAARRDRTPEPARFSPESRALLEARVPTAREAGALAVTKLRVEEPMLRLLTTLGRSVAEDCWINEHQLHRAIHAAIAERRAPGTREEFVDWLYEEIFLMPPRDPWLGLAGPLSEL